MSNSKEGYKQTDSGIIPEDWKILSLNDCLELLTDFEANGSFESVADNVNIYDNENYAWYVRATDLEKNSELSNVKFVDESTYNFLKKTSLKGGEVLITKRGEIGKVYFFQMKTKYATVAPNMYLLNLNKSVVPFYIYSFFKAEIGNKLLKEKNASSTLGALYKDDVKSIQIPLPPTLTEQTAIATALSDADGLITGLEKLIAKKRNIKKGAMQQLLQPKEGWEVKKFKDLCWFQEGPGLRNWQFTKRGIKVINVTNLVNGVLNLDRTSRHISIDEFNKMYQHFEIDENDIVVASSGNSYGKVAVVRKQDLPLVMNTSVIRFKPFESLDYNFLLIFLKSVHFKEQIDLLITGGAQPNFGPVHLNKIVINMPPTKEEQTRIATILSDMDAELSVLEQKLEKYKKIKLGMMQELLTGKTRLV
jgi:type I restriction enzyme S subunit